jgi:hypothetical protein
VEVNVTHNYRLPLALVLTALGSTVAPDIWAPAASAQGDSWIGTWATAAQPSLPGGAKTFRNQTLRLIVHTSVAGTKVRVRISNTYGDQPRLIGGAHVASCTSAGDIDPASDRVLTFGSQISATVPPQAVVVSDPVDLEVPRLSDLAVSLFLPKIASATTSHLLALQTSYVSPEVGDVTTAERFPVATTITSWPFLTGEWMSGLQVAAQRSSPLGRRPPTATGRLLMRTAAGPTCWQCAFKRAVAGMHSSAS